MTFNVLLSTIFSPLNSVEETSYLALCLQPFAEADTIRPPASFQGEINTMIPGNDNEIYFESMCGCICSHCRSLSVSVQVNTCIWLPLCGRGLRVCLVYV